MSGEDIRVVNSDIRCDQIQPELSGKTLHHLHGSLTISTSGTASLSSSSSSVQAIDNHVLMPDEKGRAWSEPRIRSRSKSKESPSASIGGLVSAIAQTMARLSELERRPLAVTRSDRNPASRWRRNRSKPRGRASTPALPSPQNSDLARPIPCRPGRPVGLRSRHGSVGRPEPAALLSEREWPPPASAAKERSVSSLSRLQAVAIAQRAPGFLRVRKNIHRFVAASGRDENHRVGSCTHKQTPAGPGTEEPCR